MNIDINSSDVDEIKKYLDLLKFDNQFKRTNNSEAKLKRELERKECFDKHMRFISECPSIKSASLCKSIYDSYLDRSLEKKLNLDPLDLSNHLLRFLSLLQADFAHSEIDLRRFDKTKMFISEVNYLNFKFSYPNLSKIDLNLVPYDIAVLTNGSGNHIVCDIKSFDDDEITITNNERCGPQMEVGFYDVRFASGGIMLRRLIQALINIDSSLKKSLFNDISNESSAAYAEDLVEVIYETGDSCESEMNLRLAKMNERQQRAIRNILAAKCRPGPYILFGPPGTGKTTTLVELVMQIYHRQKSASILVLGSSNSCADKLADDLFSAGLNQSMCRLASVLCLNARKRNKQSVPKYWTTEFYQIHMNRVVVSTNSMSGAKKFLEKSFDFVLVDEAGHACEPEALIPMNRCKHNGCIVLAGDPEQLGPVVKSREAEKLGLGLSLLARLVKTVDKYSHKNGNFDERYITRLNVSYRCDPRILHLSNELFYQGDLRCLGRTPPGLLRMLKVTCPTLFVNVPFGSEEHQYNSLSLFNSEEVNVCVEQIIRLYKMGFEPHQIGVITPYKLHKEKLIEALGKKLKYQETILNSLFKIPTQMMLESDPEKQEESIKLNKIKLLHGGLDWRCKIDTVDGFQGSERDVILISLVRAPNNLGFVNDHELGFINDEKRFNVSLSRAKWLNIVISNESVMKASRMWCRYMCEAQRLNVS